MPLVAERATAQTLVVRRFARRMLLSRLICGIISIVSSVLSVECYCLFMLTYFGDVHLMRIDHV